MVQIITAVLDAPGVAKAAEIIGAFSTFTVVEAVVVFPEVSVDKTHKVVEPLTTEVVSQETEYKVPIGVEVEAIKVEDVRLAPKLPW